MRVFRWIKNGAKWLGKKGLGLLRSNEVLIAVSLASDAIPIPALDKIILLVRAIDRKNMPGREKMEMALQKLVPILKEYGLDLTKESDKRFLIELAIKIMRKQARVVKDG